MTTRKIEEVEFQDKPIKQLNVAAYARVSSGKDSMLHSLASQVSYYKTMIGNHPEWKFVEVYADEAITGTKDSRDNFQRMINDAKSGLIDLILVKSFSRFARNTLTLLSAIRELKEINVDIFFEEENIHTISFGGELLMTILASYAQEESRSVSENMKWRIKKNFEEGIPWGAKLYGYKVEQNTKFTIIEDEAKIIKLIFKLYLEGNGTQKISNILNEKEYKTRNGNNWSKSSVRQILTNEYYCGDILLQKTYRENHLTKKTLHNKGELNQYYVKNNHTGIISKEDFQKVQSLLKDRHVKKEGASNRYPLSSKIVCSICGASYKRKAKKKYGDTKWICRTYDEKGKDKCASQAVPEYAIIEAVKRALSLDTLVTDKHLAMVDKIEVCPNKRLVIQFKDGLEVNETWDFKPRSESWTEEMKAKAREKSIAQYGGKNNG